MDLVNNIEKWKNQKLLIIGEASIDKYIIGNADRISPDAPVPNIKIDETLIYIGAIGLVSQFIKSLGATAEICTIIGKDFEGDFFLKKIKELNFNPSGIIIDENINTPQITRVKAMNQHVLRMETYYSDVIQNSSYDSLFNTIKSKANNIDGIIILDYGTGGMFSDQFIQNLLNLFEKDFKDVPIIARPNIHDYYLYENVHLIKMNLNKALNALSIDCCNETSISIAAQRILNSSKCKNVLLNYLESDSYIFSRDLDKVAKIPPILKEPVRSYIAVGSVIMAILGLSIASNIPLLDASKLALYGGALTATSPPINFIKPKELRDYILKH